MACEVYYGLCEVYYGLCEVYYGLCEVYYGLCIHCAPGRPSPWQSLSEQEGSSSSCQ